MSMGKRRLKKSGAEQDAFSKWGRKYLCYLQRAGAVSSIKKNYRRRERHTGNQQVRRGLGDE